jgi:tetratricopeptide (TPR) repeat protein
MSAKLFPFLQKWITFLKAKVQLDSASGLINLASLYEDQGKYGEAEPLYRRALAIREQQLGPQHPDTLATRGNYTALLRAMGRDREAARLQAEQPPSS